jgi:hypothetical protein
LIRVADLSPVTNPRAAERTEPNRDAHGQEFLRVLTMVLDEYRGRYQRCIVALDAPLQCRLRRDQPVRVRSSAKGERNGSLQRQADACIAVAKAAHADDPARRVWNANLQVQPGSPIPVRIQRILRHLVEKLHFTIFGEERNPASRQVIEIFPSEAIWAVGVLGHYGEASPADLRQYKQRGRLTIADAMKQAAMPLEGFLSLLSAPTVELPLSNWVSQLATHACQTSLTRGMTTHVTKGKAFDDPIESGLSFLTAVSFALGCHHLWGAGYDGTIVGPGVIQVPPAQVDCGRG